MKKQGFSLLECLITLVLLLITIGAVISFRCYTAVAAERAENQLLAAHTAHLLSEAWKSTKADASFNAAACSDETGLRIEADPSAADGLELKGASGSYAGSWRIVLAGKQFGAHFYYENYMPVDNMRLIHVIVTWQDARQNIRQFHLPSLASTI